jgi:hypothetical protein
LILLISDLRLLSATGRVNIKFETLSIDSDNASRNNAATLAVLPGEIGAIRSASNNEGISPAQIMAALMVVLRREVQARRRRTRAGGEGDGAREEEEDAKHSILATITNRKNRKEIEEDMDSLLKAYNYMIGMDLKETGELPKVKAPKQLRASLATSLLRRPMQAMQDAALREQQQQQRDAGQPPSSRPKLPRTQHGRRRLSLVMGSTFSSDEVGEVGDALFKIDTKGGDDTLDRNLTEEEILDLMEDAVESRKYGNLDFMRDFFREDSVSAVMIQSDARIVWINDWYPLKVCVFSRFDDSAIEKGGPVANLCPYSYPFSFRILRMQYVSTKPRRKCS